jgi:diacylglycerol kinase (ATP)
MQKAALLYNPDSGGRGPRRHVQLESVLALLRNANVDAQLIFTDSPAHAEEKARQAVLAGCDTILACGGDGTIHNMIQVLANSKAVLGVLPMGTANALAHDLGLPMNVMAAAQALLRGVTCRIALGRVTCPDLKGEPVARFFAIAAGAGVDAHLFYNLRAEAKRRIGMAAYYVKAWHLWFGYPMTRFLVEFAETGSDKARRSTVTELMAVRIRNFGGILRELAPGASLERNDLRLVFCSTASRLAYLLYVARGLLGRTWKVQGIDLAYSSRVSCHYPNPASPDDSIPPQERIYVEADGELVGTLPAEITIVPDALTLIVPFRE